MTLKFKNNLLVISLLGLSFLQPVFSQNNMYDTAFQAGEELRYKIKYSIFSAAEATLKVEESDKIINNQPTTHLVATGKTTSGLSLLTKVNNRYDSYIDDKSKLPLLYTENIHEDRYRRDGYALFDRNSKKVINNKKDTFNAPDGVMDVISAFYYARCFDISNISLGHKFHLDYFIENKTYPLDIEYLGKETIENDLGKFECLKFSPSLQPGRIFRKNSKMYLWITNDANRVPLKVQVEILVGSLYLELKSYKGLKYELTSRK